MRYETAPAFFEVLVNGYDTPEVQTNTKEYMVETKEV